MNWARIASFNGYIRSLDFDGTYYYVGVTEHLYPEKLRGMSANISLDNGFHVLEPHSKLTRFFPLTNAESVHSLILLPD